MRVITHRFLFKDVYKTLGIIFSFVGVLNLLIGCLLFYNSYNFFKDANRTEGTINWIGSQEVIIEYELDGEPVEGYLNFHSSGMRRGDSIVVYYHEDNPEKLHTKQEEILALIFVGAGLILSGVGTDVLISSGRRKKKQRLLKTEGRKIYAKVVSIEMDYQISNNYRHPYVLNCEYSEGNGMVYRYRSGPVWDDSIDECIIGMEVPVYVDRKNPANYYVDYQ